MPRGRFVAEHRVLVQAKKAAHSSYVIVRVNGGVQSIKVYDRYDCLKDL